jgi:hypothetical protein
MKYWLIIVGAVGVVAATLILHRGVHIASAESIQTVRFGSNTYNIPESFGHVSSSGVPGTGKADNVITAGLFFLLHRSDLTPLPAEEKSRFMQSRLNMDNVVFGSIEYRPTQRPDLMRGLSAEAQMNHVTLDQFKLNAAGYYQFTPSNKFALELFYKPLAGGKIFYFYCTQMGPRSVRSLCTVLAPWPNGLTAYYSFGRTSAGEAQAIDDMLQHRFFSFAAP